MTESNITFLEAADRIGSRLCRDAIFADNRCNWIGASMEPIDGAWIVVQRAFGADLYAGTSGIALFLARLAAQTNDRIHLRTARAAIEHVRRSLREELARPNIGFYSGISGIGYALIHIEEVFHGEGLMELGLATLRALPDTLDESTGLDVMSGCAGAILGLLAAWRRHADPSLLEIAMRFGDHLIEKGHRRTGAWSWRTVEMPIIDHLTGFSHGAAGIALSLLELWGITKEARFRQAAEAGFAYERGLFNEDHENWPDLRIFDQQAPNAERAPAYAIAWCHGAPGIGLSRLRAFELTGEEHYKREAEAALHTTARTLQDSTLSGFSLCHGRFGNTELFLAAAEMFSNKAYREIVNNTALEAAERYPKDEHWPCGVPGGGETPGLMLGLAGIGYHYLRLYDTFKNWSVLLIS